MKLASGLALLAFAFAVAIGSPAPQILAGPNCAVDATINAEEEELLRLINDYRQQNGLASLELSDTLNHAAAWKSQHMAENGYFAHDDTPIGRTWVERLRDCGYTFNTWLGENIAAGNAAASATFEQWRTSPGHNANMLSSNYTAIGIGRAFNADSPFRWYWTIDLGGVADTFTPSATPTVTPTSTTPATPTATPTSTSLATPTATPTATPAIPLPPAGDIDPDGDVSCGGNTNSIDAALVLQLNAGLIDALPCPDAADVNQDGAIDAIDAALILQYDAGLVAILST